MSCLLGKHGRRLKCGVHSDKAAVQQWRRRDTQCGGRVALAMGGGRRSLTTSHTGPTINRKCHCGVIPYFSLWSDKPLSCECLSGVQPGLCFLGLGEQLGIEWEPCPPYDLVPRRQPSGGCLCGSLHQALQLTAHSTAALVMILGSEHYPEQLWLMGSLLSWVWEATEVGAKSYLRSGAVHQSRASGCEEGGGEAVLGADIWHGGWPRGLQLGCLPRGPPSQTFCSDHTEPPAFPFMCEIMSSLLVNSSNQTPFPFCHNLIRADPTHPSRGREIPSRSWKYSVPVICCLYHHVRSPSQKP